MLLTVRPGSFDESVLDAMERFCPAWAPTYDQVFFTEDHYSQPSDGFRVKVDGLQATATTVLREAYRQAGVTLLDVPEGLETDQRVAWIARRVTDTTLLSPR